MTYEKAEAEIVVFDSEDVITTSGGRGCNARIGVTCGSNAVAGGGCSNMGDIHGLD